MHGRAWFVYCLLVQDDHPIVEGIYSIHGGDSDTVRNVQGQTKTVVETECAIKKTTSCTVLKGYPLTYVLKRR